MCAALLVPLTISDVSGQPMVHHLNPVALWSLAGLVNTADAWRWTAVLAATVTLAGVPVLRWSWTPPLLLGSLVTLIPLALTGHSSAGGSHDLATNSLLIHLVAASIWAGGLLALLAHALRAGAHTDLAARRFSAIALWCWVAMAFSGVVNALVRVLPADLLTTGYGRLVLAKLWRSAHWAIAAGGNATPVVVAVQQDPSRRGPLIRLALVEAALFGVTFGIAVGLGRTPPPPPPIRLPSIPEAEIGYGFDGPPTVARLLFDFRFDLVFGTAAIVFAALYVAAVLRLRRRRRRLAAGSDGGVAARLPVPAGRDVVGGGPVHAGDVQHAHGRPHGVVHAGARSCWCWPPRSPLPSGHCRLPGAPTRRECGNGCWRRCTARCRAC